MWVAHAKRNGSFASAALALGASTLVFPVDAAHAQEKRDIRVRVGLGAQLQPAFIGADQTEWAPMPELSFKRGTKPFGFGAPDESFGFGLLSKNGFSLGPAVNVEGSRKNVEVDAPIGKVSTTIEAGAFAQYELSKSLRLRGEVRKGLGGHDGVVGNIGADYVWRDGDRYVISLGPRLLFSDSRYQRAYFGVTPATAIASGLPAYRPGGGVHSVAATSGAHVQLRGPWGLFGFARYERLIGDAAKSPIVRELGSPNQYSAGLGLTYTFTVRR